MVLEGALGVWTGWRTPRLPWLPWYAPPALPASQRWARPSKFLPKTTGCHQGRWVFQAACDQLFIKPGWMCRAVYGCTANISPLPYPEGRSQWSKLSKTAFSGGNQAITSLCCGLGSVQMPCQAACAGRGLWWAQEQSSLLELPSHITGRSEEPKSRLV